MDHIELTEQYRGRRFQLGDDRAMTISHINPVDGEGGPYFRVIYDLDTPEPGSTGRGSCWLDLLPSLVEIPD